MKLCSLCQGPIPADAAVCPRDGARPQPVRLAVGDVLDGRYRLLSVLGQGALGDLYRAEHTRLRRTVVVKVLRGEWAQDPVQARRLLREGRVMSRLRHPHIAEVTDCGELSDGRGYLVRELLDGRSLREVLRAGRPAVAQAAEWGRQMALGVQAAHAAGIVHRDLRPENVFVVGAGPAPGVKIVDFGLARVEGGETLTGGGAQGAPEYLSPEQGQGREADAASDQYALGCVLYEMLTGAPPLCGGTLAQVLERRQREEVSGVPGVAAGLSAVVVRALRRDPAARFASVGALAEALREARRPVRVYVGAAARDGGLRDELMRHLAPLERAGAIEVYHEGRLPAGAVVREERRRRLAEAEVVVLLVSPDLLAERHAEEVEPALARRGEAVVVPVVVREVDWESGELGGLKGLPGGRAVGARRDRDGAWREVVEGLREVVARLR